NCLAAIGKERIDVFMESADRQRLRRKIPTRLTGSSLQYTMPAPLHRKLLRSKRSARLFAGLSAISIVFLGLVTTVLSGAKGPEMVEDSLLSICSPTGNQTVG